MRPRHVAVVLAAAVTLVLGPLTTVARTPVPASAPVPSPTAVISPAPTSPPTPAAAPTSVPAPTATPAVELMPASPALAVRLDALLTDPALAVDGELSIAIVDADGDAVASMSPDQPTLPASTLKLVTAAAALAVLGPDYRYVTRVYAAGPLNADGALKGDLVLVGAGDPALATALYARIVYPQRPRTPLEDLADQLVSSGLRRITGAVVGDPSVFAGEPIADGWPDRYLDTLDATRASGLTVNGGLDLFEDDQGNLRARAAPDPASEAAAALTALLRSRGVTVDGDYRAGARPSEATRLLARVASPPLTALLTHTVQRSDNHMADAIFRTVGAATGQPTWEGAALATQAALAHLDLDWSRVRLADGSGLSRRNRLPAQLLADLDRAMTQGPDGPRWRKLMAVAGRTGTLRRRLRDTIAEGRLHGKTGLLRDTRGLAGAVHGPTRTSYHLAVLGGKLGGPEDVQAVRHLADLLVLALTADLYGCTLTGTGARLSSLLLEFRHHFGGTPEAIGRAADDAAEGSFVGAVCGPVTSIGAEPTSARRAPE